MDGVDTASRNAAVSAAEAAVDAIDLSIIICTYRRYDYLERLIPMAARQRLATGRLEVMIVDNTDDEAVVKEFYDRVPLPEGFRFIRSTPPGLSRARNVGLREARGRYALFLDDDAEPSEEWAQAIYDVFESYPDAAVVGGPILPVWPSARPAWLSSRYEGCLTILDAGNMLRKLKDWEHAYGANIAVHIARVLEIGGFPENLGRKKSGSLLSNEELLIQNELRARGYACYYSPEALVFHHAHPDRLNQAWMRRRMAWQVVSDAMSWDSRPDASYVLGRVAKSAAVLGLDPSFLDLLTPVVEPEKMDAQLDLIVSLVEALLSSNGELSLAARSRIASEIETYETQRAAPISTKSVDIPLNLKTGGSVFLEATPGHDYLFDAYSGLDNVSLLTREFDPWRGDDEGIATLLSFLDSGLRTARSINGSLVLMTMDYWSRHRVCDRAARAIVASGVPVHAMLHRFPHDTETARYVRELGDILSSVIVLSPDMQADLQRMYNISNARYLPHHAVTDTLPLTSREAARRRLHIPEDRHVVGVIGEAREGKGIELVLAALPLISPEARKKLYFVFAGKSRPEMRQEVGRALKLAGVDGRVDLRHADDRRIFAVLNELEYTEYLAATDTGLLIYQGPQRTAMSGVLPCYVRQGAGVIVTANSFVGRLAARNDLGRLLIDETPEELASVLNGVAAAGRRRLSQRAQKYADEVSNAAVLDQFGAILRRAAVGVGAE